MRTAMPRDYRSEYDNYHAKPVQKKRRAKRNAARREMEKEIGDLPSSVEVNHKQRLAKGGTNAKSNLETKARSQNRAWRKGKKGYDR